MVFFFLFLNKIKLAIYITIRDAISLATLHRKLSPDSISGILLLADNFTILLDYYIFLRAIIFGLTN